MLLKDVLPYEFMRGEFDNCKAMKFADIKVVQEYESYKKSWIGNHKYVHFWYVLENGYAVGFNENPSRGWSFPVVKYIDTKL
jgi:hypothetical protein